MGSGRYINPILPGFNPDPSIIRVEDSYFLATSSFEYFPGVPIYHSRDLIKWTHIGHALTRRSQLELRTVEPGAGVWAATLRYRKDEEKYYVITGKFDRYRPADDERIFPRGFFVTTSNIWDSNSWSDPVYFDNIGFDQDLFWDDGKVYLSTTSRLSNRPQSSQLKDFAIHISQIDLPTGRTLSPPVVIKTSPSGICEGSHIIKKDGYYYLFTAEGGTEVGHHECVSRSKDGVLGPWEQDPRGPVCFNGSGEEVRGVGHADLVEDPEGGWWAVLLGVRPRGGRAVSQLGRETFLVPVTWKDGWPVFNNGRIVSLQGYAGGAKGVYEHIIDEAMWSDDFNSADGTLSLGWYFKNSPLKPLYSLTARPGHLRLYGGPYSLTSPECPTMLLRKQTSFSMNWFSELDFYPEREGYEAGVVVWWSMYFHATISIKKVPDGRAVTFKSVSAGKSKPGETGYTLIPPEHKKPVFLIITATESHYSLGFNLGMAARYIGKVAVEELTGTPLVGGSFTGAMFGIYSTGLSEPCLTPADFSGISTLYL